MRIPVFGEVIFSQNVIEFSLDVLLFLKERGIMFITGKKVAVGDAVLFSVQQSRIDGPRGSGRVSR